MSLIAGDISFRSCHHAFALIPKCPQNTLASSYTRPAYLYSKSSDSFRRTRKFICGSIPKASYFWKESPVTGMRLDDVCGASWTSRTIIPLNVELCMVWPNVSVVNCWESFWCRFWLISTDSPSVSARSKTKRTGDMGANINKGRASYLILRWYRLCQAPAVAAYVISGFWIYNKSPLKEEYFGKREMNRRRSIYSEPLLNRWLAANISSRALLSRGRKRPADFDESADGNRLSWCSMISPLLLNLWTIYHPASTGTRSIMHTIYHIVILIVILESVFFMAKVFSSCHQDTKARKKLMSWWLCDKSFWTLFRFVRVRIISISASYLFDGYRK